MSEANVEVVRGVRITLSPSSERASRRRTLDQRLFLCFPALFRLLADRFMRLPPRSRLRRLIVVRRVGQAYAAANRRDFDSVLVGIDPGRWEYRPSRDLLRRSLVVRQEDFLDHSEALEAAGLRE